MKNEGILVGFGTNWENNDVLNTEQKVLFFESRL